MENESYTQDSRKRALDGTNDGYNTKKRFNSGKPTLKFLIPNFMAGKLIGKGGSSISELQSKFDASIQISRNNEYFPGTMDRVVCISADIDQIIEFSSHIISEFDEDGKTGKQEMKLVISDVAAGLVIGKGGASIKAIQNDSDGARINISKKEESVTGERVLVISGHTQQLTTACKRIIEVMSDAPDKMSNNVLKYNTFNNPMQMPQNNSPMPVFNYQADTPQFLPSNITNGVNNMMSSIQNSNNYGNSNYQAKSAAKAKFQVEMEIPDKMVGVILGKQGQTIMEFGRSSGAKLQFSKKDEYAPGTTDRILTITGGMYQVQNAYILVDDKLAQMEHQFNQGFVRQ